MKRALQSRGWGCATRRRIAGIVIVLILIAWPLSLAAQGPANETVMYNAITHKVHKPTCVWAIRCTMNCIPLKRSEAYKRGGVSCKVCGG